MNPHFENHHEAHALLNRIPYGKKDGKGYFFFTSGLTGRRICSNYVLEIESATARKGILRENVNLHASSM
jgi:hypothetical protein